MQWIAPSEKDDATQSLEKGLRDDADQFRANSGLKAQECSAPVLGLMFSRFAEGWSLNPGRYVGVAPGEVVSDEDFKDQLETLNAQGRELEKTIADNVAEILGA